MLGFINKRVTWLSALFAPINCSTPVKYFLLLIYFSEREPGAEITARQFGICHPKVTTESLALFIDYHEILFFILDLMGA